VDGEAADPDFLVVGHLAKAHGIRGELYVWSLTDHPESVFVAGVELQVSDSAGEHPSDAFPGLEIEAARPYKRGYLVKFVGLDDRTEAERVRGRYLMRPFEEAKEPGEDELFYHQLLGMRVETTDGRQLGTVHEVYEVGRADLLEIRGPEGTFHVPFVASMIREIDVGGRRLVVDPVEGLLDQ